MASFHLIHASDFHIGIKADFANGYDINKIPGWFKQAFSREITGVLNPSTFWVDKAVRFTYEVEQQSDDLDAVLLTGDIATTGSQADLFAAMNFIHGNAPEVWSFVKESFRPLRGPEHMPPLILMPGNHDRYAPPTLHPRSPKFEEIFGAYWNFNEPYPSTFTKHKYVRSFVIEKDGAILVLCAVDFSLVDANQAIGGSVLSYLGQGFVSRRSHENAPLEALDELIEQTKWAVANKNKCSVIWCVHYPPRFPGIDDDMRLIHEDDLIRAANDLEIQLILSGHTHEYNTYFVGSRTRVVCCGTAMAKSTSVGHQYLDLRIDTNNLRNPKITQKIWGTDELGAGSFGH